MGFNRKQQRTARAFTLVEMTVALGVFGLVALAMVSLFITSLRISKKTSAAQAIIDNTRYAVEFMEREMRTGRGFRNDGAGTCSGVNILEFTNDRGKIVCYKVDGGALKRFNQDNGMYEDLTAPTVLVMTVNFFELQGNAAGDKLQPRITLLLKVKAVADPTVFYDIETTVSQRDLDS